MARTLALCCDISFVSVFAGCDPLTPTCCAEGLARDFDFLSPSLSVRLLKKAQFLFSFEGRKRAGNNSLSFTQHSLLSLLFKQDHHRPGRYRSRASRSPLFLLVARLLSIRFTPIVVRIQAPDLTLRVYHHDRSVTGTALFSTRPTRNISSDPRNPRNLRVLSRRRTAVTAVW